MMSINDQNLTVFDRNFTGDVSGEVEAAADDDVSMLLGNSSSEGNDFQSFIEAFHKVHLEGCQGMVLPCEERPMYKQLLGHGFVLVFLLATFGNCINLLIYKSDHIRYYIAIRMLCTRLLMNSLAMLFLLPQALRIAEIWEWGSEMDHYYWRYYPYQIYFVNVFGFCAMWLTVLMTGECYLHVFFPSHSKSWCTKRNLSRSYVIIFGTAMLIALIYPLNRTASLSTHCDKIIVTISASEDPLVILLERVHTVANLFMSILAPMGLLVFMTMAIVWKLLLRRSEFPNTSHFTSEKRCVTRITLITTSLQLLAELPPIPVFVYAAAFGPTVTNERAICIWNTIGVFLGLCNMSLSFFVYLALSEKFRQMVKTRLCELFTKMIPCILAPRIAQYGVEANLTANLLRQPLAGKSIKNECPTVPIADDDDEDNAQLHAANQVISASCCTDSYLLNERSSVADDAFL